MRCAPYAIRFANDPDRLIEVSKQSSAITHADPRCTYGCAILNLTLRNLITGREQPLDNALERLGTSAPNELVDALDGLPEAVSPNTLSNSGYVVDTLQASLYYGLTADTAEDAIVMAVNQGNDADTVGAVTGAISGARFGADALPERWHQAH
jgi:ADP-ribosyl-[dinitrogen reductase] hydrolase